MNEYIEIIKLSECAHVEFHAVYADSTISILIRPGRFDVTQVWF